MIISILTQLFLGIGLILIFVLNIFAVISLDQKLKTSFLQCWILSIFCARMVPKIIATSYISSSCKINVFLFFRYPQGMCETMIMSLKKKHKKIKNHVILQKRDLKRGKKRNVLYCYHKCHDYYHGCSSSHTKTRVKVVKVVK